MPRPVRIRLSRAKGFDLQALSYATNGLPAVNVARPSRWGNPWVCIKPYGCPHSPVYDHGEESDGTPSMHCCIDTYREWIRQGIAGEESHLIGKGGGIRAAILAQLGNIKRTKACDGIPLLRGKNLACWCPWPVPGQPDYCHASVLLEIANA